MIKLLSLCVHYLISLPLRVRVIRHLPFSMPGKWVPVIARGALPKEEMGCTEWGYVEVGLCFLWRIQ